MIQRHFNNAILITILLSTLLTPSCRHSAGGRWSSYGKEADAIVEHLDSLYLERSPELSDTPLIDSLQKEVSRKNRKNGESLVSYWKAVTRMDKNSETAANLIRRARMSCDSAHDPYLASRIKMMGTALLDTIPQTKYITLRNLLEYYESISDTTMVIKALHALSSFYLDILDYENFHECSRKIAALYELTDNDSAVMKNRMNFALYHILKGDSIIAADIINELLTDKRARKDSVFMGRLYVDISLLTHEPDSMMRARTISPEFRNNLAKRYSLEFAMAMMYDKRGDTELCDSMLKYLTPLIEIYGDNNAKKQLYAVQAKRNKASGNLTEALEALERCLSQADALITQEHDSGIDNYIHRDNVKRIDIRHEQEKYATRIRWTSAVMAMLFLVGILGVLLWNRHRHTQLAKTKAERDAACARLNLEREQRSIVAMELAMIERNNLVKDVSDALDDLNKAGRISADDKQRVKHMIRESDMMRQEWEVFRKNYEKVHPEFLRRLSEDFPALSEGDVRLALYITTGMNTKQIAQLMHIRPDSVKKNRQRLRRHMNLPATASLEGTLRNLTNPGC